MNEIIVDESAITSPEELEAFFLNALETDARISPSPLKWKDALEEIDVPTRIVFKRAHATHKPWWDEAVTGGQRRAGRQRLHRAVRLRR